MKGKGELSLLHLLSALMPGNNFGSCTCGEYCPMLYECHGLKLSRQRWSKGTIEIILGQLCFLWLGCIHKPPVSIKECYEIHGYREIDESLEMQVRSVGKKKAMGWIGSTVFNNLHS